MGKLLEVSRCAGVLQWLVNSRSVTCPSLELIGTLTWLQEVRELGGRKRERKARESWNVVF